MFLLLAGVYVGYYGWYELRVNAGAFADDPIVGAVTDIQGQVTTWLDALGVRWIAGAFALAVVLAMALRRRRKQSASPSVTDNVT